MVKIKKYTLKNGSSRFEFQLYLGKDPLTGKDKQTTRRGFKTRKEAAEELKKLQFQLANGDLYSSPQKPVIKSKAFVEVYKDWLIQYETTVQASTLGKTVGIFKNHILPVLGKYLIDQITVEMCQQFINKYPKKLKKFKDVINYSSLIFEFALKRDYIQKNPMKLIDRPKPAKKVNGEVESDLFEGNFYTVNELKEFIVAAKTSCDTMTYTFLLTLAYSGIRKGEAFALKWKDIDFEKGLIRITKALSYSPQDGLYIKEPKNGLSRNVYLDQVTLNALAAWKDQQKSLLKRQLLPDSKQLLFHNKSNDYFNPSYSNRWMKKVQKEFNLKQISTHGLRHTHCTLLLEAGVPPREVMERLGHLDIEITMKIYAHVTEQAQTKTAERFVNYLNTMNND